MTSASLLILEFPIHPYKTSEKGRHQKKKLVARRKGFQDKNAENEGTGDGEGANFLCVFHVYLTLQGLGRRGALVAQHLNGAGSSPAGSVVQELNLRKLNYQYLTTGVAVVLVVR